jgi:hypothetical protein
VGDFFARRDCTTNHEDMIPGFGPPPTHPPRHRSHSPLATARASESPPVVPADTVEQIDELPRIQQGSARSPRQRRNGRRAGLLGEVRLAVGRHLLRESCRPETEKRGRSRPLGSRSLRQMPSGRTIRTLDEVAIRLRAGDAALDHDTAQWVADQLERAADRAQEVADLRAALVLLRQRREL